MIRPHSAWYSPDPKVWSDAQRRYQTHLKKIEPRLPPVLGRFVREFTLHDDRISHIQSISAVPRGRDALVTIRVFRDGYVGTASLLVLHLAGLRGPVRPPPEYDIMYFDVEVADKSEFQLSFALEEKKSLTVRFSDFGFYLYDYRERPNQASLPIRPSVTPRACARVAPARPHGRT